MTGEKNGPFRLAQQGPCVRGPGQSRPRSIRASVIAPEEPFCRRRIPRPASSTATFPGRLAGRETKNPDSNSKTVRE